MDRMTSALRWSVVVLAACAAFPAAAPSQVLEAKWNNPLQVYSIYSGMPAECDAPTQRAATTWTNAASRFSFAWGGLTHNDPQYTDDGSIVITAGPMTDPNYGAVTQRSLVWNSSQGTYNFTDADVIINENFLFYDKYYDCGSDLTLAYNQLDYESIMLHELGHVLGFGDIRDSALSATVMWWQGPGWAKTRRALTTTDRNGAIRNYGAR